MPLLTEPFVRKMYLINSKCDLIKFLDDCSNKQALSYNRYIDILGKDVTSRFAFYILASDGSGIQTVLDFNYLQIVECKTFKANSNYFDFQDNWIKLVAKYSML